MSDEPLEKFAGYLTLAQEALGSAPPSVSRGTLRLVHSSPTLAERVSPLEATEEFRALWQILETRLGNNGLGSRGWDHAVGNWFRRSGIYHRIAVGETLPDIRSLLDSLCAELARRESTITYLALVEHVDFRKRRLDFGRYEITRFSKEEFDTLLQSRVRSDFYPWAVVPTLELARYWWVVIRKKAPTTPIGRTGWISVNLDGLDVVGRFRGSGRRGGAPPAGPRGAGPRSPRRGRDARPASSGTPSVRRSRGRAPDALRRGPP